MRILALILALLGGGALAEAQVPTMPIRVLAPTEYVYSGTNPISALSEAQNAGDWDQVQTLALKMLNGWCDATYKKDHSTALCDRVSPVDRNYFNLIWLSTDKDSKPAVARVLVHDGLKPEHATDLPGLHGKIDQKSTQPKVLDVFLSKPGTPSTLRSVYLSTQNPNPLLAQLSDVFQKSNVLGFLAAAGGGLDANAPSITVTIYEVNLPFADAVIQVTDQILTVALATEFAKQVDAAVDELNRRQLRSSTCGKDLASAYAKALKDLAAKEPTCVYDARKDTTTSNLASCVKQLTAAVSAITPAGPCVPVNGFDPVVFVDDSFRAFIAKLAPQTVVGQTALKNKPLTWASFGLMAGYMPGHTNMAETRVSVQSGKIATNPMPRNPTFVIFNIHPWRYDGTLQHVSWQERVRAFAGTAITPDFGVTFGVGFGIVRGLAVNFGPVWFFSDTLRSTETLNEAPKSKDPFETKSGLGGFVGVSYSFSK